MLWKMQKLCLLMKMNKLEAKRNLVLIVEDTGLKKYRITLSDGDEVDYIEKELSEEQLSFLQEIQNEFSKVLRNDAWLGIETFLDGYWVQVQF